MPIRVKGTDRIADLRHEVAINCRLAATASPKLFSDASLQSQDFTSTKPVMRCKILGQSSQEDSA